MFELFPALEGAQSPEGRDAVRRRTADARDGSRARWPHPKLLMLDEPSMGLAPMLVEKIFDIVKEINAQGTTILLVEQNAHMALEIADRGYVLETGQITLADDASVAAAGPPRARGVSRRGLTRRPARRPVDRRHSALPFAPHQRSSISATAAAWSTRSATGTRLVDRVRLVQVAGTERHRRRPGDPGEHGGVVPRVEPADAAGPPDVGAGGQRVRHDRGRSSGTSAGTMSHGHSHSGGCSASQSSRSVAAFTHASTSSKTA